MSSPRRSGVANAALGLFAFVALADGCGRIGIELTPLEAVGDGVLPGDAGWQAPNQDGEGGVASANDGGPPAQDGAVQDSGAQDSAARDSGSARQGGAQDGGAASDAAPLGCLDGCDNAHGSARCVNDLCVLDCAPGFADCDGRAANGCETPLDTPQNCGTCGNACAANDGIAACSAGVCTTTCNLTGSYALKLSIPTSWQGSLLLSSGSGEFAFWALFETEQSDLSVSATVTPCGETVPDFRSSPSINELYGVSFTDATFDRMPPLPGLSASGTLGASGPGASLTFARTAFVMGATLTDPVQDPWPSASELQSVDTDGDGKPGLTAAYKSALGYMLPPLNDLGTTRGQLGYFASRVVFSMSGTLTSCTTSTGSVSTTGVDTHTVGCRVIGNLRDCLSVETDHLDQNAPVFASTGGAYSLVKVADGASCAAVRAALP